MAMTASALRRDIPHPRSGAGDRRAGDHRTQRAARRISADDVPSRLDALVRRPEVVVGDSEDFVHLDWSDQWNR